MTLVALLTMTTGAWAQSTDPTVIISDDKTSAEFDMPSYDATLEYDIVRNLGSNMTLNLFIGTDAVTADARLRIAKNAQSQYAPVSPLTFTLTDAPEGGQTTTLTAQQALAAGINPVFYLQGADDSWVPVAAENINAETHLPENLAVGQVYRMALKAADDAPLYGGETLPSFTITLFEGYEVEVAAQSFITYYKDEALTLDADETAAELYTISSVSADEAVLSAQIGVAPANTPLLVYNSGSEKKTILLIPTDDQADNVTAYSGFKGTLVASTIAASTNDQTNYALNGKQFVWVKNALSIGANKCWLEVVNSNARAISILFGEATGIESIDHEPLTIDDWYDLNGRKLQGIPTKKGVYIFNGRKVVVK